MKKKVANTNPESKCRSFHGLASANRLAQFKIADEIFQKER